MKLNSEFDMIETEGKYVNTFPYIICPKQMNFLLIKEYIRMNLASCYVNVLRVCFRYVFLDYFAALYVDIFAVQDTKLQEGQIDLLLDGYETYWNYAERKGYSGTAVFTKHTPLN